MACKYFAEELGNFITIGIGQNEIARIWFNVESESMTPLSKEETQSLAETMVDYLEENHPITKKMEEKFGDSDIEIARIKMVNRASKSDNEDLARLLMLGALMGD